MNRHLLLAFALVCLLGCDNSAGPPVPPVAPQSTGSDDDLPLHSFGESGFSIRCPQDWSLRVAEQEFFQGVFVGTSPDRRFSLRIIANDINGTEATANAPLAPPEKPDVDVLVPFSDDDTPEVREFKQRMRDQILREWELLSKVGGEAAGPTSDDAVAAELLRHMQATPEFQDTLLDSLAEPVLDGWLESEKDRLVTNPKNIRTAEFQGVPARILEFDGQIVETKEDVRGWAAACLSENRFFYVAILAPAKEWDVAERVRDSFAILPRTKPTTATGPNGEQQ